MVSTRRQFMIGCSAAIAAMAGSRLVNLAWGEPASAPSGSGSGGGGEGNILVVVFLRGGMDSLNLLAPVDDRDYIAARDPHLRLLDSGEAVALPLTGAPAGGDFRLHPQAKPLKELYDAKHLAFVHACGLTDGTRSHFEAMDMIERGAVTAARNNSFTGWLARYLAHAGIAGTIASALPAVSGSGSLPNSLLGYADAVPVPDPANFRFAGSAEQLKALQSFYAPAGNRLASAGAETLQAFELVQGKLPKNNGQAVPYRPENGAEYGDSEIGRSLRSVAQLVKMDLGLRVATVDFGGWDTHQQQIGYFPVLVGQLSTAMAAFYNDLSRYHDRLSLVVMSEFGRRLKANQSEGTDHGHGGLMMVLGGGINGGKIHGTWPGLATEQLDHRADLAVTTDYRLVLAELLQSRFGVRQIDAVFPELTDARPVGIASAG